MSEEDRDEENVIEVDDENEIEERDDKNGMNPKKRRKSIPKKLHEEWPGFKKIRNQRGIIIGCECEKCEGQFSKKCSEFMRKHKYVFLLVLMYYTTIVGQNFTIYVYNYVSDKFAKENVQMENWKRKTQKL